MRDVGGQKKGNQMRKSSQQQTDTTETKSRMPEVLGMLYPWHTIGLEHAGHTEEKIEKVPLPGNGLLSGIVLDQDRIDKELAAEREKARICAERLADIDDSFARSPYLAERLKKQITTEI